MIRAISKEKMTIVMIFSMLSTIALYYFNDRVRNRFKDVKWEEERCEADLETTRYQLSVVTEYKNKIENLLTETKSSFNTDKDRFNDFVDSCVAMKQQVQICQDQFNELAVECKAVKQRLDKALVTTNGYYKSMTTKDPDKLQTKG